MNRSCFRRAGRHFGQIPQTILAVIICVGVIFSFGQAPAGRKTFLSELKVGQKVKLVEYVPMSNDGAVTGPKSPILEIQVALSGIGSHTVGDVGDDYVLLHDATQQGYRIPIYAIRWIKFTL